MWNKKETFKVVTPIPGFIPRQLAIDLLHSHSEVITLNPLVLDHKAVPAPRDAPRDEYFSSWYEITERIQYVPGLGKLGSGKIRFHGCFHDMPWGLQTHIYAPLSVDLLNTYRIGGNQPGVEPPQPLEIGLGALGAPADGLYLLEDIEIRANITVVGFVKAELKRAGGEMVQRIIKKAELLDAGVLRAMMQADGRLRTINPADRSAGSAGPSGIPSLMSAGMPYRFLRPDSSYLAGLRPGSANVAAEVMGQTSFPARPALAEMAGDASHRPPSPRRQPASPPPPRPPSSRSSAGRWSAGVESSRPASVASTATGGSAGYPSPGLDHKGFSLELSTHPEEAPWHGT